MVESDKCCPTCKRRKISPLAVCSSLQTPKSASKSLKSKCPESSEVSPGLETVFFSYKSAPSAQPESGKTILLQALECALTLSALKNLSHDEAAIASLLVRVDNEAAPELSISRKNRHDLSGLHSGKWSPEENNYANCIVDHFRNGSLRIPDGSTLRAVLAEKLGCVS